MVIFFDAPYASLYDLVAPDKSHIGQSIIDPGGCVGAIFFDPSFDVFTVGIQHALAVARWRRPESQTWVLDILFNGGAADAQFPGDGSLLQPLVVERDNVQYGLLFFKPVSCHMLG